MSGYNERLFSGGIRKRLHLARFFWLKKQLQNLKYDSILELGCFDGRAISHLPHPPKTYSGFDANWEGGLDLARKQWGSHPEYRFRECTSPEGLGAEAHDVSVCMETLEHVPDEMVVPYLEALSRLTRKKIYITVPMEKGPIFALKAIYKGVFHKALWERKTPFWHYVLVSCFWMKGVPHRDHMGFDYSKTIGQVGQFFDVERVESIPFKWMPLFLGFGVGIVGAKNNT